MAQSKGKTFVRKNLRLLCTLQFKTLMESGMVTFHLF